MVVVPERLKLELVSPRSTRLQAISTAGIADTAELLQRALESAVVQQLLTRGADANLSDQLHGAQPHPGLLRCLCCVFRKLCQHFVPECRERRLVYARCLYSPRYERVIWPGHGGHQCAGGVGSVARAMRNAGLVAKEFDKNRIPGVTDVAAAATHTASFCGSLLFTTWQPNW